MLKISRPQAPLAAAPAVLGILLLSACGQGEPPVAGSTLIENALLFDGSGAPGRTASVRIAGDRIVEVGELEPTPRDQVIDARGLALAPGFIDTHSHHDGGLSEQPAALAAVSQGITTIVAGQDGGSELPLASYFAALEKQPVAINVASYVGHGTVRDKVMGKDFRRPASEPELEAMRQLVRGEMEAGALGLSTGLEYDPGIYSSPQEVLELAKVAAGFGGRYISHLRSEDRGFWPAVEELLTIGRETGMPVEISHVKLAMVSLWGQAPRLLERLDRARAAGVRVTADIYPYTYWSSTLTVLFPQRDFENRATAELVLAEVAKPEGLRLGHFEPEPRYAGKTVAEISVLRGTDPATTLIALIREAGQYEKKTGVSAESVMGTSMDETDVEQLLAWPHTSVCSDGTLDGSHPRGFGAFPRVLGRYVREREVLELAEAVRRMTGLAAESMGFEGRGRLEPGYAADLVLFDPATVADRATVEDPHALAAGIETVWVNGQAVFHQGKATGARPGRVIRRATAP